MPSCRCSSTGGGQDRSWLHVFDVEFGLSLFFGFDVGFSPGEFLDFLLGWFGIDIANDDTEEGRARRSLRTQGEPEKKKRPEGDPPGREPPPGNPPKGPDRPP
jgi:hypothetical protein